MLDVAADSTYVKVRLEGDRTVPYYICGEGASEDSAEFSKKPLIFVVIHSDAVATIKVRDKKDGAQFYGQARTSAWSCTTWICRRRIRQHQQQGMMPKCFYTADESAHQGDRARHRRARFCNDRSQGSNQGGRDCPGEASSAALQCQRPDQACGARRSSSVQWLRVNAG